MTQFIDLDRRFLEPTDEELEDVGVFGSLNIYDFLPMGFSWPELLTRRRIIVLAEAGSGKTVEMQEQAKKLLAKGEFALFVPLESLDREPLTECLSPEDESRFEQWKLEGQAQGWFFLDAVDELKLTEGKLDWVLNRLSRDVGGHLHRLHIIISCRPGDWRPDRDLTTVRDRLPVPPKRENIPSRSSKEAFERNPPVNIWEAEEIMKSQRVDAAQPENDVLTVAMLPMSREQIERFAKESGMQDPSAFLDEVFNQKAWSFARRPLDLINLITIWNDKRHLGTRKEQHETNVKDRLKDDPERLDRGVLTDEKSRLGAECLALALALTRTRTIRSSDQTLDASRADSVLEPAEILPSWTEEKRQTLLRRGLFDPATYGRIRFHHRSVQEYLAACRLRALRKKGMSTQAVFRVLFAEQYGVKVVFPSMREITAWLALWDNAVCNELIEREPEALLALGDPGALDLATRRKLLRKFVATYGRGSWHGLHREILREAPRFADPELASVIRECWGNGPTNEDVRGLLLKMILEGPIADCADLARTAALDSTWHKDHRITAIRAMLACGDNDAVREIADDMLLPNGSSWPDEIVRRVTEYLFPKIITADELMTLMKQRPESESITGGFARVSRTIVATIQPWSPSAIALRNKMADLIQSKPESIQPFSPARSKFDHLAEALAWLCDRQLSDKPYKRQDDDLIRSCVVASRFMSREIYLRKPLENLRTHFEDNVALRRDAFWTELTFMDSVAPERDDRNRFLDMHNERMWNGNLVNGLKEQDRPWLEKAIADRNRPERRGVALHAWIQIWRERGQDASELDTIRPMLRDNPVLERIFEDNTAPPEQNEERQECLERQSAHRERIQNDRIAQYLEPWTTRRNQLLENPDDAFSEEKRKNTVSWLFQWWCKPDFESKYNTWNKEALVQAFNRDIADRAEQAMRKFWRSATRPVLWSARPVEERNSAPTWEEFCRFWCVLAEVSTPGWTDSLSPDEARIAAVYATVELNNFPPFITDLTASHPTEVDKIIGGELSAELSIIDSDDRRPTLHKLTSATDCLKKLVAPRLLDALFSGASTFSQATRGAHNLTSVLQILDETSREEDRGEIAQECAERYEAAPHGPLALAWLKGLFRFDAERGTQVLTASLADSENPGIREQALGIFAELFSDHGVASLKIADPKRHAKALGQLVRCAHTFIRPEEDQNHEGVYSPDTRDNAQIVRNSLLNKLLDTPGPEARRVTLNLINENVFGDHSDYIRLQLRRRTAADAEFPPYSPQSIIELQSSLEIPPQDRNSLFSVMMARLEDLQHYFIHDDFTDRTTVININKEIEMQRTLARRIRDKANGAYIVTREEEVADQKRTDIRLHAVRGGQKVVIEVKIADNWSLNDLDKALRNQLVEKYLRHENCKAGCLLLTHHGKKSYWICPDTNKHLHFPEMVAWLNRKAQDLEQKQDIRLEVFGLDLT